MATRIRLQRHGKKGKPFFHLVAADSRAKRDGKFIEKLGTYNPTANPAVIDINFDATLAWVQTGAEMSETARAILSYKGVLYKNHLLNGVKKGALTAEQVEVVLDKYTIGKVAFTMAGYKAIVPDLTADEGAKILGFLKQAREQAVDYKSMKEISAIFEIYKTQAEQYLNNHGRNWRQMYGDYVKKVKAEKAAKKQYPVYCLCI